MTIFVVTSAMVSMMASESDADGLADRLGAEQVRLCSAISVRKTIAALWRIYMFSAPSARAVVQSFIELNDLKFDNIGERESELAAKAYAEFGRERHPARISPIALLMPARRPNRGKLFFKGDHFAKTEIRPSAVSKRGGVVPYSQSCQKQWSPGGGSLGMNHLLMSGSPR